MNLKFTLQTTLALLALSATTGRSGAATVAQLAILDATPIEVLDKGSLESTIQFSSTAAFAADFAGGFDFQFDVQPTAPTRYGVKFLEGMDSAGLGLRFGAGSAGMIYNFPSDLLSISSVTWYGLVGAAPVQTDRNAVSQTTYLGQNANDWLINLAFDYAEDFSFTSFSVQGHAQSPNISNGSYTLNTGSPTGFNSGFFAWAESPAAFGPDTTLISAAAIPEPSSMFIIAGMISSSLLIRRRKALI